MKVVCDKKMLEYSISIAERFTGKNTALPVLSYMLIEAKDKSISITTTNLEYAVVINITADIKQKGKVCLPARVLSSLIRSISSDKIELSQNQNNVLVLTDNQKTKVYGISTEEFPIIPGVKKEHEVDVLLGDVVRGIRRTIPAVSLSEFKPEFTGVFFNILSTEMYITATDTFRLAEQKVDLPQKNLNDFSFILPQKISQEISKIEKESNLKIVFGENQVLFRMNGIDIISRIVEGTFPDYKVIIPKEFDMQAVVKRDTILGAVRSSGIFVSKLQDVVLRFKGDVLEIYSANTEIGENRINIPLLSNTASQREWRVAFNYRYLMDGLESVGGENVLLGYNLKSDSCLFQNEADNSFLYLLKPIKLT